MHIISLVQQKGGVGKTTLAINLAGEFVLRGHQVVLTDADPQASATAWAAPRRLGFEVRHDPLSGTTSSQWVRDVLRQTADFGIIDTPAGLGPAFRAAVDVADLIVVPCGPSSLDVNAARATVTQIATILRLDPRSRARIVTVPTRVEIQLPEGQQIANELGALGEVVAPALSHDVAYVRAFAQGVAVGAAAPESHAAVEVRALAEALLGALRAT